MISEYIYLVWEIEPSIDPSRQNVYIDSSYIYTSESLVVMPVKSKA